MTYHPDNVNGETRICDIIPDGHTMLEYTIQVKTIDINGEVHLCTHRSAGLSSWEAFGMVTYHADGLRSPERVMGS